jgi:hypothetical protein
MPASRANLETGSPSAALRASRSQKGPDPPTGCRAARRAAAQWLPPAPASAARSPSATAAARAGPAPRRGRWGTSSRALVPASRNVCFHFATDIALTPRRRAASAALISPASTDNTTRTLSSSGIFNRGDLATDRLLRCSMCSERKPINPARNSDALDPSAIWHCLRRAGLVGRNSESSANWRVVPGHGGSLSFRMFRHHVDRQQQLCASRSGCEPTR